MLPSVGADVPDGPAGRIGTLARGVGDAAPYDGASPVGAGVLDGPAGRFGTLARGVGDAAPYEIVPIHFPPKQRKGGNIDEDYY